MSRSRSGGQHRDHALAGVGLGGLARDAQAAAREVEVARRAGRRTREIRGPARTSVSTIARRGTSLRLRGSGASFHSSPRRTLPISESETPSSRASATAEASTRGSAGPSPTSARGARPRCASAARSSGGDLLAAPGTSDRGRSAFGAAGLGRARVGDDPALAASRSTRSAAPRALRIDEFESPRLRRSWRRPVRGSTYVSISGCAELARALDRQPLRAQLGHEVLGEREVNAIDRHRSRSCPSRPRVAIRGRGSSWTCRPDRRL